MLIQLDCRVLKKILSTLLKYIFFFLQTIDPTDNKFARFAASSWAYVTLFTLLRWATPNLQYLRDIKNWNQLVQVHKESFGKLTHSKLNYNFVEFNFIVLFMLCYRTSLFLPQNHNFFFVKKWKRIFLLKLSFSCLWKQVLSFLRCFFIVF